ncbi:REST corepressor 1-like [Oppia nitens]|uniref:REST corepressor 1-like n=1 Tax=Oppia nitens TaxID=1686743 RepID=UPI0023DAFF71|nr:REST corepressor 1-like [Oppia nitens]
MVLADRLANESKYNGSNGRRNRAVSPQPRLESALNNNNGIHSTDDSNHSDDSDHGMRVGSEYQAIVPEMVSILPAPDHEPERAVLVWSPCNDIPDIKLDDYLNLAKEKYTYNSEQALGMLCWHKFNLEKAMADLPNFTPFPDEWTVEDKVLFEQAFQFHDKHFHKIRQMLPDKSIASLVKYYYSWKKTRSRTSLMDRQAKKLTSHKDDGSDVGSDNGSDNESDTTNNKELSVQNSRDGKPMCSNCFTTSSGQFHNTNKGVLCRTCYSYWRRTGAMKNTTTHKKHESASNRHIQLKPRKPPRGMYLSNDDLIAIANGPPGQGDAILKGLDSEVITLKRNVQNNKQIISQSKHKIGDGMEGFRLSENTARINSRWSNDELLLGVQGVRKYGKDFKAIAEVIGNKSEAHVRTFYANHQKRFNLNAVLKEYENENGVIDDEENKDKTDNHNDSVAVERSNSPQITSHISSGQSTSGVGSAPPPLRPIHSTNTSISSKIEKSSLLPRQPPPPPLTPNSNLRSNK